MKSGAKQRLNKLSILSSACFKNFNSRVMNGPEQNWF